jgi:glyoxylase-like metal-dependent hydrolase (beta-lactamase superfamily II)
VLRAEAYCRAAGIVELIPALHFLRFPIGHAYLYEHDGGLTLADTSAPGSAAEIAAASRAIGRDPARLGQLVLTHFHADHAGAAAQTAAWGCACREFRPPQ